jgi:hypothetical protein
MALPVAKSCPWGATDKQPVQEPNLNGHDERHTKLSLNKMSTRASNFNRLTVVSVARARLFMFVIQYSCNVAARLKHKVKP